MLWLLALVVAGGVVLSGGGGAASGGARPKIKSSGTWHPKGPRVVALADMWGPWRDAHFEYEGTIRVIRTDKPLLPKAPKVAGVAAAAVPVIGKVAAAFMAAWNAFVSVLPKKKLFTTSDGEMRGVAVWADAADAIELEAEVRWGERNQAKGVWGNSPACAMQVYEVSVSAAPEAVELPFDVELYSYDDAPGKPAYPAQNDEATCQEHALPDSDWVAPPGPQTPRLYLARTGDTWSLAVWLPGRHRRWWVDVRWRFR